MNQEYFFTNYQIKKKFNSHTISRVKTFMLEKGFLGEDQEITPRLAAIFIILASCTVTETDLQTLGRVLPTLETKYPEPENLAFVVAFILSDELKAASMDELIFDRMKGHVIFKLVDGSEVLATNIPIPIQPDWKEPGGIVWKREELVALANSLSDEVQKGEILPGQ